jgi:hypothetical protein
VNTASLVSTRELNLMLPFIPLKGILEYVHADLWGPSCKKSLCGPSYMLTIIDDYSRKVWLYFPKHKYETFDAFRKWKVMIEKQLKRR